MVSITRFYSFNVSITIVRVKAKFRFCPRRRHYWWRSLRLRRLNDFFAGNFFPFRLSYCACCRVFLVQCWAICSWSTQRQFDSIPWSSPWAICRISTQIRFSLTWIVYNTLRWSLQYWLAVFHLYEIVSCLLRRRFSDCTSQFLALQWFINRFHMYFWQGLV